MKKTYKIPNTLNLKVVMMLLLQIFGLYVSQAQEIKLIGTGTLGGGSVYAFDEDGSNPERLLDLTAGGGRPTGDLLESNGKLWGMAYEGGAYEGGIIFTLDLDGTNYTKIHDFDIANGMAPYGSLIESNGKLWGLTTKGGASDVGVVFTIDADGTFTKVHDFDAAMGSTPYQSLLESNGKLWGTTIGGGASGDGVIFTIDTDGSNYTKIHDFDDTNGSFSFSTFIESNGKLWGTTYLGGASGVGVVFTIDTDGSNFTKVHDFTVAAAPVGNLVESNGKVWGVTEGGGSSGNGVIFSIDTDASNFTIAHEFNGTDGSTLYGGLVESNSKLWGMTFSGGENSAGVIFSIDTDGSNFTKVHDFDYANGGKPEGALIESNGKLWGMTTDGGISSNMGNVFSMDTDGSNLTNVYYLEQSVSLSSSIQEIGNKLWGMTTDGGSFGHGTIYTMDKDGSDFTVLHDFDFDNGGDPFSNKLQEINGKVWGATYFGGTNSSGVLFTIDLDGSNYTKIRDFEEAINPIGGLIESEGKVYGTTANGGAGDHGTIFSIDPDGSGFAIIHEFDDTNGRLPRGELTENSNKLWGVTFDGGAFGDGVIYTIDVDGSNYTKVHDFNVDGANGDRPYAGLISSNGKLWGATSGGGGEANKGIIYSIDADGTNFTVVHYFDGENGGNPRNQLVEHNNKLWGETYSGGSSDLGVLFSINTDGTEYTKEYDFSGEIDGQSSNSFGLLVVTLDITAPAFTSAATASVEENTAGVAYTVATDDATATITLGTSKDESLFTLANENEISFTASPDFEDPKDGDANNDYVIDVIAEDESGNSATLEVTITVTDANDNPLSVFNENKIGIYPNPAVEVVSIADASVKYAVVYNLMGAKVYAAELENGTLNVKSLRKGLYVLTLMDGAGNILSTNRLMKE